MRNIFLRAGLAVWLCCSGAGMAGAQQVGNAVNSGLNSDAGTMSGPNINRVAGTNTNGTPRQQLPGSSMTNGAGNGTMTPEVTGTQPAHGIVIPTINGQVVKQGQ